MRCFRKIEMTVAATNQQAHIENTVSTFIGDGGIKALAATFSVPCIAIPDEWLLSEADPLQSEFQGAKRALKEIKSRAPEGTPAIPLRLRMAPHRRPD